MCARHNHSLQGVSVHWVEITKTIKLFAWKKDIEWGQTQIYSEREANVGVLGTAVCAVFLRRLPIACFEVPFFGWSNGIDTPIFLTWLSKKYCSNKRTQIVCSFWRCSHYNNFIFAFFFHQPCILMHKVLRIWKRLDQGTMLSHTNLAKLFYFPWKLCIDPWINHYILSYRLLIPNLVVPMSRTDIANFYSKYLKPVDAKNIWNISLLAKVTLSIQS